MLTREALVDFAGGSSKSSSSSSTLALADLTALAALVSCSLDAESAAFFAAAVRVGDLVVVFVAGLAPDFGTGLLSGLTPAFRADLVAGVADFAAGLAGVLAAVLAAADGAFVTALAAGLGAGLVDAGVTVLAACLDGGDAFLVTDFIASLTTGLALAAGAALALDVETWAGAADLLPDLGAATVGFLGAGLETLRTGTGLDADLAGLAAIAGLIAVFLGLAAELPFFTVADCLALTELFLDVACLPEDLVMMV